MPASLRAVTRRLKSSIIWPSKPAGGEESHDAGSRQATSRAICVLEIISSYGEAGDAGGGGGHGGARGRRTTGGRAAGPVAAGPAPAAAPMPGDAGAERAFDRARATPVGGARDSPAQAGAKLVAVPRVLGPR